MSEYITNQLGERAPTPTLRLAWMAGIWACSLVALGVVAWVLRLVLTAAGLKSH